MTAAAISKHRFINQHIGGSEFNSVNKLVQWMGAIQAQDYTMAKWAIGVRLKNSTNHIIEETINKADIIRTHVLRPTWHFIAAKDARWMLELTARNLKRSLSSNNKLLELDEKTFRKCNTIIKKLLINGKHLTRKEIMAVLEKKGVKTNPLRAAHIMFRAETDLLVCNGIKREKEPTYALFDERIPPAKKFLREEALAELATRYFQSHGPASLQDFTWWSGLSITDARNALELVKNKFSSERYKDSVYWFTPGSQNGKSSGKFLLPAFDEFLISYKSREISLDPMFGSKSFTSNGIFKPIIVHNAKVIGTWKPQYKKEIKIKQYFFYPSTEKQQQSSKKPAEEFCRFMRMKIPE